MRAIFRGNRKNMSEEDEENLERQKNFGCANKLVLFDVNTFPLRSKPKKVSQNG